MPIVEEWVAYLRDQKLWGGHGWRFWLPFPEEVNRRLATPLVALHFAPTEAARAALLREAIPKEAISVTGNTGIDAQPADAGEVLSFKSAGSGVPRYTSTALKAVNQPNGKHNKISKGRSVVSKIHVELEGCMGLTVTQVARLAGEIYRDAKPSIKYKQGYRPYICPFHLLVDYIPHGASVLDVGCGAGLFILLLARLGRIRSAVGFDADDVAIHAAQDAAAKLLNREPIQFETRSANDRWPEGRFDVVSIIDVMHHVPTEKQTNLIAAAAEHLNDGGLLLYKDMASRPLWRALANRFHDLVSVQEWIHYAELDDVINWATDAGMQLDRRDAINMLWYRHESCLFHWTA